MHPLHTLFHEDYIDILKKYEKANPEIEKEIQKKLSHALMQRKENENYHDTYFFEQEYYGYVEKGDAEGLDIETAYQLSDTYIQEMEKMSDITEITMLNYTAVLDFTRRVADATIPKGMSQEIFRCIQYISNHVNQTISAGQIADFLNMDRSTLSKKFKRELGFNISSFITSRKLEEAKSLLIHTDKSISEISEYLCFSSQAYFQNVFKKKYGITPRQYRLKH